MLFRSFFTKKVGGLIGCLGLEEFWLSCSDAERETLNRYIQGGLSTGTPLSLDEGKLTTSQTQLGFLSAMIGWAESDKNYALADKIIAAGMSAPIDSNNLLDAHYFWQNAAEYYYKQRDIRDDAIMCTIDMCQIDIDMFPKYSVPMKKEFGNIPRITTFSRLIVVYENMGRFDEAITICKLALKYKLKDNTKGGYEERLKKLESKQEKTKN